MSTFAPLPGAAAPSARPKSSFWLMLLASLAIALPSAMLVAYLLSPEMGNDQGWYLYATRQMMHGTQLFGPHLTETNPPLILWFTILPDGLAGLTHITPALALKLITVLLIGLSTWWSSTILRRSQGPLQSQRGLLTYAILIAELYCSPHDFAQREQLMVLFTMPYFIAAVTRARLGISERALVGIAAGVGICLKPQQVLVLIALELCLVLTSKSLRRAVSAEFLALVATGVAYLALIRLITPQYLTVTLPLLRDTYWANSPWSMRGLIKFDRDYDLTLALAAIAYVFARSRLRSLPVTVRPALSATPAVLLTMSFAAFIAFTYQRTGLFYQRIPQIALLILGIAWLLTEVAAAWRPRLLPSIRFTPAWRLASFVLYAILLVPLWLQQLRDRPGIAAAGAAPTTLEADLDRIPAGTPVSILTLDLASAMPRIDNDHLVFASRFVHLWMLRAIVENQEYQQHLPNLQLAGRSVPAPLKVLTPARTEELATLQRRQVAEDLAYFRPKVIYIERCDLENHCLPGQFQPFDTLQWFAEDPAFAAEMQHYVHAAELTSIHGTRHYDRYDLGR